MPEKFHNQTRVAANGSPFEVANNASRIPQTLNYIDCYPIEEKQFGEKPVYSVAKREAFKSFQTWAQVGTLPANLTGMVPPVSYIGTNSQLPYMYFPCYCSSITTTSLLEFQPYGNTGLSTFFTVFNTANFAVQAATVVEEPLVNNNVSVAMIGYGTTALQTQVVMYSRDGGTNSTTSLTQTIDGNRGLVYLDSYLFAVGSITTPNVNYNVIFNSSASGGYTTWNTTDFTTAVIYAGEIRWLDKHHNHVVAFCDNSVEFFYDGATNIGSPLVRQPVFAKNIGVMVFNPTVNNTILTTQNRPVAKDKDDIYFIGKNENNVLDVYKLSNYQISSIGTHYVREVLNYFATGSDTKILGIESIMIDTHTMIMITFDAISQALVYFPESDCWVTFNITDLNNGTTLRSSTIAVLVPTTGSHRPYYITYGGSTLSLCGTDLESTISNTGTYYTEVVDFGTNYWKHIARLDAVGDYGNNTLTLSYSNNPNYITYVSCGTKNPVTQGTQNAIFWRNVTRFRRGTFKIDMTGIGPGHHKALDIEYNMGVA